MRALPAGELTGMVGDWMAEKVGRPFTPGTYAALMIVNDDNDFVAGVVVNNYIGHNCEISCATESPAAWRPQVMQAVFAYIFTQLGCVRCTATTKKSNKRARAFLEALGFTLEGNVRKGYDGKHDALIYGMLAGDCRFLAE